VKARDDFLRERHLDVKLEASGNLDLARVKKLRNFGLDFFSVGELTHSVKALDLSLKIGSFVPGGSHG
jgi:nicotinate-nucleotide pyrophosphorylase (carboxylating)